MGTRLIDLGRQRWPPVAVTAKQCRFERGFAEPSRTHPEIRSRPTYTSHPAEQDAAGVRQVCSRSGAGPEVDAKAAPTRQGASRTSRRRGARPVVKTVSLQNINGLNGVSGGDVGKAEASINGSSVYTITGTAAVSDPATPGQTKDMPFTIEAPC